MFAALLVCLAVAFSTAASTHAADRPVTGEAVKGYETLDQSINDFMTTIGANAAVVAVSVDGEIKYARGFGWRDEAKKQPTQSDDLMRIASVSKPITSAMVRQLWDEKKVAPDTKAFEYLGLKPAEGGDPRLADITMLHLMAHQGGWDRSKAGDPMFKVKQIEKELKLEKPATPTDVVRYMLSQPLQLAPGEKDVYSNFGFCVLGRVIEKADGKPFADCLNARIAEPLKIEAGLKIGRTKAAERDPKEVWYPVRDDAFSLDVMDAHGGMIASAPALCRFLKSYWINGGPRKAGDKPQRMTFFGSLPGTTAMVLQRRDGVDVAVLLNGRRNQNFVEDNADLEKRVMAAMDGVMKKE